jgi:hypothetical protein
MLCATFLMIVYLGFKLGISSEYRDFAPGAEEQLAQVISVEGKLPDDTRDSQEIPTTGSKAVDQPYGSK